MFPQLPKTPQDVIACFPALPNSNALPVHATTGFPLVRHSLPRMLSFALQRWPHSCPTAGPQLPHSCPTVVPNRSPNSAPNCFQTVSRLCLNCAQTVPRHAVARAIARVTGEAYRLTRLTRHSLACCQTSPDSPDTLLQVARFPHTRRHSLACC